MSSDWPDAPFRLIRETGVKTRPDIPRDHYCRKNAQLMALTHNSMFRGLNAIYNQALQVRPGTQDAADLLLYCEMTYDFVHDHHRLEEEIYFPGIQQASGIPELMSGNIEQHRILDIELGRLNKYAKHISKEAFDAAELRCIIDGLVVPVGAHLRDEIPTILDLHDKLDSKTLEEVYAQMARAAGKTGDLFKLGPFIFGTQDFNFLLDDERIPFPEVPHLLPYVVDYILARRYTGAWRFSPSSNHGRPRPYTGGPAGSGYGGPSSSLTFGLLITLAVLGGAYLISEATPVR